MKGQFTIVALLMTFVAIVVFVAIYPVLNEFITIFVAESEDQTLNMVVQLLPFFMVLAIIMSFVWYIIPQRQQASYG